MLTLNDVRILYLRLLRREPRDTEIVSAIATHATVQELESEIIASTEYQILTFPNRPPSLKFVYHEDSDTVHVNDVPEKYPNGVVISNGRIGFKTTGDYHTSEYNYVRSVDGIHRRLCYDFTNIRLNHFSEPSTTHKVYDNSQTLNLSECKFATQFVIDAEPVSVTNVATTTTVPVHVKIERFPLYNHKSCMLQKYTLLASGNDANLIFSHQIRSKFTQFKSVNMVLDDGNVYTTYEVDNFDDTFYVNALTMTSYSNDSNNIRHIGNLYQQSDVSKDDFEITLPDGEELVVYVLTSITINTYNDKDTNTNAFNNLIHTPFAQLIDDHITTWRNMFWNTNVGITPKQSVTDVESKDIHNLNALLKRVLFSIYTDCYEFDMDIDLFVMPILVLLKPSLAKRALHIRNHQITSLNNNIKKSNIRDGKYKWIDRRQPYYHNVVLALSCIHSWNTFRVTRDKNWLLNNGYPFMAKCSEHLVLNYSYQDTRNNTMTNYLVNQAIEFTNQALYELNYVLMNDYVPRSPFTIPYFDDTHIISPSSTTIVIRVEEHDSLYNYVFYDDDSVGGALLGYRFGGNSGYKLALAENTDYTFKFDFPMIDYPIRFSLLLPEKGFYIIESIGIDTINLYIKYAEPALGTTSLVVNSSQLVGYENKQVKENGYDIFKGRFNTLYGNYAFITQTLNNIIKPTLSYNFELLSKVESFAMFNSYYNATFFKGQSDQAVNAHKSEFVDIVRDNVVFYSKHSSMPKNELSVLLEAGLEGIIAQGSQSYSLRKNHIQLCEHKLIDSLKDDTMNAPWFLGDLSSELLFIVLTSMFELSIRGETNRSRTMISDYALKYTPKNVLPLSWSRISAQNVGYEGLNISLNNAMFMDSPFNEFPDGMMIVTSIHDITSNTVYLHVDWTNAYPSGIPPTFQYYVVLQDLTDDTDYTLEENQAALLSLAQSKTLNEPNFDITYTPIETITYSEVVYDVPELHNRTVYVVYAEDGDFNNNFKFKLFKMSTLPIPSTPNRMLPYAELGYEIADDQVHLTLSLSYTSLLNYTYQPFTEITLSIAYDSIVFDKSDISHTSDNTLLVFEHTIDNKTIDLTLTIPESAIVNNVSMGTIKMKMNYNTIYNLASYASDISVVLNGNMHIVNTSSFPPRVELQPMPPEFVNNPLIFLDYQNIIDGYLHPISALRQMGGNGLGESINSLLATNPAFQLVNVFGGSDNAVFQLKDADANMVYYGIGFNQNNMLMTNVTLDHLTNLTPCIALQNLVTAQNSPIKEVHTTNLFSMVILENGKVYGIGYNESFNLGDGTSTNRSAFVESTLINDTASALNTSVSKLVLNDKAVLIVLENNHIYGLGDMSPVFISESSPIALQEMLTFTSAYDAIERIECGYKHFKFQMRKGTTYEWWGIGLNTYNNMGLDTYVDSNTEYTGKFHRLHMIERFTYGKMYEISYSGVSAITPNAAYMVRAHDLPVTSVVMLDTTTNKMYKIGTFDPDQETVSPNPEWIEIDLTELSSLLAPKFLSMCGKGFVVNN